MTDEAPKEQSATILAPPPGMVIGRSPHYRIITSNFVRYRLGVGEFAIVFGAIGETPGSPVTNLLQEEVQVVMSWAQLKSLAIFLREAVEVVETKIAEIPIPDAVPEAEGARRQSLAAALQAAGYKKAHP